MEIKELVQHYFTYLTHLIEVIGILIIVWGFFIAFKDYLIYEFSKLKGHKSINQMRVIRITLGNYILIGLEFMIASDIIGSFVSHSLEQLYYLVIIVFIRTTISYFLGREIAELPQIHESNNK